MTGVVTYSPKVFIPLTKLCRDVCHYCTFAQPPRRGERAFMTADEVLAVARTGAEAGCHEALFTLGDKPELRYRAAREELAALGCETTIEYLARMAELVLSEAGLLPHLNPGVMTREDLELLRPVSASMGLMLESTSLRLMEKGMPHHGSPDKLPEARLETIRLAGELAVPFTTGILIGIGETREERLEALEAIAELHERYGHIQEVIVQNFRAKPGTRMVRAPGAVARRADLDGARGAGDPAGGRAPAGAAEPLLRRLPAPARVRDRRLGRRLAGDDRPRQPGGAVAGDRAAAGGNGGARLRAGAAAPDLPRVRGRARPLGRPAGGRGDPAARGRVRPRARGALGGGRCRGTRRACVPPVVGRFPARSARRWRRCRPAPSWTRTPSPPSSRHAAPTSERCSPPPTSYGARSAGTRSATSSRGTSTTPTSATSAAASAPSPRASSPRTCAARPTSCRWRRSCAARARRGTAARSRSASRAASTPRSRARRTWRSAPP